MQKRPYKPKTNNTDGRIITGSKVYVKNDDVNGALRKLKKILESDNRQKDLSKHEFFEKNCTSRKRAKEQAKKRTKKEQDNNIMDFRKPNGSKWLKGKRSRRKVIEKEHRLNTMLRKKAKSRD